jgi:hypothetical protein
LNDLIVLLSRVEWPWTVRLYGDLVEKRLIAMRH